eukprot:tig00000248_g21829.t1
MMPSCVSSTPATAHYDTDEVAEDHKELDQTADKLELVVKLLNSAKDGDVTITAGCQVRTSCRLRKSSGFISFGKPYLPEFKLPRGGYHMHAELLVSDGQGGFELFHPTVLDGKGKRPEPASAGQPAHNLKLKKDDEDFQEWLRVTVQLQAWNGESSPTGLARLRLRLVRYSGFDSDLDLIAVGLTEPFLIAAAGRKRARSSSAAEPPAKSSRAI